MANRINRVLVDECCLWLKFHKTAFMTHPHIVGFDTIGGVNLPQGVSDAAIYSYVLANQQHFDTIITADSDFRGT